MIHRGIQSYQIRVVVNIYDEFFRNRVTHLRVNKNISARDMSLSLGQSASYINKIENGRNFPTMQNFFYLCEYLGVTPLEFFDEELNDPPHLKEVISNLKHLNKEQLSHVAAIVEDLRRQNVSK